MRRIKELFYKLITVKENEYDGVIGQEDIANRSRYLRSSKLYKVWYFISRCWNTIVYTFFLIGGFITLETLCSSLIAYHVGLVIVPIAIVASFLFFLLWWHRHETLIYKWRDSAIELRAERNQLKEKLEKAEKWEEHYKKAWINNEDTIGYLIRINPTTKQPHH